MIIITNRAGRVAVPAKRRGALQRYIEVEQLLAIASLNASDVHMGAGQRFPDPCNIKEQKPGFGTVRFNRRRPELRGIDFLTDGLAQTGLHPRDGNGLGKVLREVSLIRASRRASSSSLAGESLLRLAVTHSTLSPLTSIG